MKLKIWILACLALATACAGGIVMRQFAAAGGGPAEYGNLSYPYSGTLYRHASGSWAVFFQFDAGTSVSTALATVKVQLTDFTDSSREGVVSVWTDDGADYPSECLGGSGRFSNGSGGGTEMEKAITGDVTFSGKFFIAVSSEKAGTTSLDPGVYYTASTGGIAYVVTLATGNWLTEFDDGSTWAEVTGGAATVTPQTWVGAARLEVP